MTGDEAEIIVKAIHPKQKYAEWLAQKEQILIEKFVNADDLSQEESDALLAQIASVQAEMMGN